MLTLKNRQNSPNGMAITKMAFIALVSTMLLFNQSIFAAKNNKNSSTNQQRQQISSSTPAPRYSPNISAQQNRISTRSNITKNRPSSQQFTSRNNIRTNSSPTISQPNRTTTIRQPDRVTSNRNSVSSPGTISNNTNFSPDSSRTIKSTNTNFNQVNTNSNIRINQDKALVRNYQTNNLENTTTNRQIGGTTTVSREPSATQSRTSDTKNITTRSFRSIARSIGSSDSSGVTNSNDSTVRENRSIRQNKSGLSDSTSIANVIGERKTKGISTKDTETSLNRQSGSTKPRSAWSIWHQSNAAKNQENNNQGVQADSKENNRAANTTAREQKSTDRGLFNRNSDNSRQKKNTTETRTTAANRTAKNSERTGKDRTQLSERDRISHPAFEDRPNLIRHSNKNVYVYKDRFARTHYRVIRPEYQYILCYDWGWHHTFGYFYPYYHRKYIFVSLCGFWPFDYTCLRYYWYGYHPYYWYGYYPIAREVEGDTYNYYTYNYYGVDNTTPDQSELPADYIQPVDHNTFADVREKLAQQQAAVPDEPTPADIYFENAVKAFETGDFNLAALQFAEAIKLAPDDTILPFAYSQALLANEQYSEAAKVLREALSKVTPDKEGVFYPRGLYANDKTLTEHIDRLTEKAKLYSNNADLQLLLGYQLLGMGKTDEAFEPLWNASQDQANAKAATVLLELRETIKNSEGTGDDNKEPEETENIQGAENTEDINADMISASNEVINNGYPVRLKETIFMATLLTLVTGSGIYHIIRC